MGMENSFSAAPTMNYSLNNTLSLPDYHVANHQWACGVIERIALLPRLPFPVSRLMDHTSLKEPGHSWPRYPFPHDSFILVGIFQTRTRRRIRANQAACVASLPMRHSFFVLSPLCIACVLSQTYQSAPILQDNHVYLLFGWPERSSQTLHSKTFV